MVHFTNITWLINWIPRTRLAMWVLLLLLVSITDGIGIFLLVPMLALVTSDGSESGLSAQMFDALAALGISPSMPALLAIFVGLICFRALVQFHRDTKSMALMLGLIDDLRETCIRRIFGARWQWIVQQKRSDHLHILSTEVGKISGGLMALVSLATALVTLITYLAVAAFISPVSAFLFAATSVLGFLAVTKIRRNARQLGNQQLGAGKILTGMLQQNLSGLKLAKIMGAENRQIDDILTGMKDLRETQKRFHRQNSGMQNLQQVGAALILAIYVFVGFAYLEINVPALIILVVLFGRLLPICLLINRNLNMWINNQASVHAVRQAINISSQNAESSQMSNSQLISLSAEIELHDVTVFQPGRPEPTLKQVSHRFIAGSKTVITGPSGSGKSTVADIIMALRTPDDGALIVDGEKITDDNAKSWRKNIAYVPQEGFLFHDSIRYNLMIAKPDAQDADLIKALRQASAEFVLNLPDGLDTIVGDDGNQLSGGERQRIALARALLREPEVLILDEATSALDPQNEIQIVAALKQLPAELTVIILGHNLAAFDFHDTLITLDDGHLAIQKMRENRLDPK